MSRWQGRRQGGRDSTLFCPRWVGGFLWMWKELHFSFPFPADFFTSTQLTSTVPTPMESTRMLLLHLNLPADCGCRCTGPCWLLPLEFLKLPPGYSQFRHSMILHFSHSLFNSLVFFPSLQYIVRLSSTSLKLKSIFYPDSKLIHRREKLHEITN